jgi:hypothetical protein
MTDPGPIEFTRSYAEIGSDLGSPSSFLTIALMAEAEKLCQAVTPSPATASMMLVSGVIESTVVGQSFYRSI